MTVLLSFEEKQMMLAQAHNRDTFPLTVGIIGVDSHARDMYC